MALREREAGSAPLIDAEVRKIVAKLEERRFCSPYRRDVVARVNPVRFHRTKPGDKKPPMPIAEALTRMAAAAKRFDAKSVKAGDLALVAALAPEG